MFKIRHFLAITTMACSPASGKRKTNAQFSARRILCLTKTFLSFRVSRAEY